MKPAIALKISAVLFAVWGVFHLLIGVMFIPLLMNGHPNGDFSSVPEVINFVMGGMENRFAIIASLKQHSWNLAWFGLVVTIGSYFIWKPRENAIFLCVLTAGFADAGYFLFVDLGGYADPPGPQMTYICAAAIITSLFGYFKSNKLKSL